MSYMRVIPRDLFNEAKLLKCLGQLALHVHNYQTSPHFVLEVSDESKGFEVELEDTSLVAYNVLATYKNQQVRLFTPYNSREPYPLYFEYDSETEKYEGYVLQADGSLHPDFKAAFGG